MKSGQRPHSVALPTLSFSESLKQHWPEYLMEAAALGILPPSKGIMSVIFGLSSVSVAVLSITRLTAMFDTLEAVAVPAPGGFEYFDGNVKQECLRGELSYELSIFDGCFAPGAYILSRQIIFDGLDKFFQYILRRDTVRFVNGKRWAIIFCFPR